MSGWVRVYFSLSFSFFKCFLISVLVLNIKLHNMCTGNAIGCDQNLMVLITEHTPWAQTARLAGIQIRCYLGSWFKMAQNEKNKITFPYITGIDQKTIKDNSTCKLPKWYIFVWAKNQWGVYKLMSRPGTSILNWKDK